MPPTNPMKPPTGDISPNPNDILILGGGRWLTMAGQIITTEFGDPVGIQLNTLAFWEAAALRGVGNPLSELLAPCDQHTNGSPDRAADPYSKRTFVPLEPTE